MARFLGFLLIASVAVACASKPPPPADPPREVASKPLLLEVNAKTVKSTKSLSTGKVAKTCSYIVREDENDFGIRVGSDDAELAGLFYVHRQMFPLKEGFESKQGSTTLSYKNGILEINESHPGMAPGVSEVSRLVAQVSPDLTVVKKARVENAHKRLGFIKSSETIDCGL